MLVVVAAAAQTHSAPLDPFQLLHDLNEYNEKPTQIQELLLMFD